MVRISGTGKRHTFYTPARVYDSGQKRTGVPNLGAPAEEPGWASRRGKSLPTRSTEHCRTTEVAGVFQICCL